MIGNDVSGIFHDSLLSDSSLVPANASASIEFAHHERYHDSNSESDTKGTRKLSAFAVALYVPVSLR